MPTSASTSQRGKALPEDVDGMNDKRAEWAAHALQAFMSNTRAEKDAAVADLICDLMHLADRDKEIGRFEDSLRKAVRAYCAETGQEETSKADRTGPARLMISADLSNFVVLYRDDSLLPADPPLGFQCDAENSEHAEEQCENAYPGCTIAWVWQGPRGVGMEPALQDYWNSGLQGEPDAQPGPAA